MAVGLAQQFTQNIGASKESVGNLSVDNLIPETFSANALLHELQLGEQLITSVVETRRADFSLMLAMLAEDVREHSQFLLPQTPAPAEIEQCNSLLRKAFNLPKKAPLALSTLDELNQFNQAHFIINNNIASIQLSHAMAPKPLAFRDNKKHICAEILDNTSLCTQLKYKQAQVTQDIGFIQTNSVTTSSDKPLSQPLNFNAKAWLDGIQQSLVKAPLLNLI